MLALCFHFVDFGLNLYNDVMYFQWEILCSEWIICEFQGAFLYGGFKIRYAFFVRSRGSVRRREGRAFSLPPLNGLCH